MRTKSQGFLKSQKFFSHAKRQPRKKLKSPFTDFGGEFANTTFQEFTFKKKIQ